MKREHGNAKQVIIPTESVKFGETGVVAFFPYREIGSVYTDDHIPQEAAENLRKQGIGLYTAPFAVDEKYA